MRVGMILHTRQLHHTNTYVVHILFIQSSVNFQLRSLPLKALCLARPLPTSAYALGQYLDGPRYTSRDTVEAVSLSIPYPANLEGTLTNRKGARQPALSLSPYQRSRRRHWPRLRNESRHWQSSVVFMTFVYLISPFGLPNVGAPQNFLLNLAIRYIPILYGQCGPVDKDIVCTTIRWTDDAHVRHTWVAISFKIPTRWHHLNLPPVSIGLRGRVWDTNTSFHTKPYKRLRGYVTRQDMSPSPYAIL